MKCPKDGVDMLHEMVNGVELDRCPKCQGVWVDWGELQRVSHGRVTEHEMIYRGKSNRCCTVCSKPMRKADLHSVIVEECGCGLFFDWGELSKVLGIDWIQKPNNITLTKSQLLELGKKGKITVSGIKITVKKD